MSGFDPISIGMMVASTGLKVFQQSAQARSQASYQQAVYAQQQAQAQAQAQAQMAQLQASYDSDKSNRQRRLKSALASQRAAFGAAGLESASSGSAGAVLNGLVMNAADEQAESDKALKLKSDAIGQSLSLATQRNLLEQSRQFPGSSAGLGLAGSVLKSLL